MTYFGDSKLINHVIQALRDLSRDLIIRRKVGVLNQKRDADEIPGSER